MRQLFSPRADAFLRLAIFAAVGCVVAFFVLAGGLPNSTYATGVGAAPFQPVPFSHKHHAGELGIDCRYCHTSVMTQATAGIPPTHTCMTCHSQIWNKAPMLAPVRQSLAEGKPLDWQRIYRLPGYVYFDHSIHVTKGIGCSSCHGPVTEMQMTWQAENLTMDFCVSCHRHPEDALRTPQEMWNMHWTPPANQEQIGARLMRDYHIVSSERLTDCSTCHR